ncbi:hypothetical protein FMM80_15740 [Schaedlerella arabinosiphila]|uniref:Uncharacterized protein n=1 Tax=Schaedlerella arabinosiphila TaxID=2044587 RepID=A0A9X5CC36_9FIRM|nr:hypothetical protein [Schaedlerella arabinosiphila]
MITFLLPYQFFPLLFNMIYLPFCFYPFIMLFYLLLFFTYMLLLLFSGLSGHLILSIPQYFCFWLTNYFLRFF